MTKERGPQNWEFGWYPDPDHPGEERYWNGSEWTERRVQLPPTDSLNHGGQPDPPAAPRSLLLTAGVAGLVVVGLIVVVVLMQRGGPISEEDDDAEFREVSLTECEAPALLAAQEVRGVAENGSSKRSDYRIEVAVFSSDGTRIGTGTTVLRDVEPGQRAVWSSETDADEADWDEGSTCEVVSVERTASF